MAETRFDLHQFAGKRGRAVTKASGIAFSDYGFMHKETGPRKRYVGVVPAFALDERKLAEVLKRLVWRYAHGGRNACPEEVSLEQLKREAEKHHERYMEMQKIAHLTDYQRNVVEAHGRAVKKAGGYLQMYAHVAWLAWRRGMTSTEISIETGVAPYAVRQYLFRMNVIARRLFPEDSIPLDKTRRREQKGMKHGDPNPNALPVPAEVVIKLLQIGLSPSKIAEQVKCPRSTVEHCRYKWERDTGSKLPRSGPRKLSRDQKASAKRLLKIAQGTCGVHCCLNPVAPGKPECIEHVEYYLRLQQERRARLKEARNMAALSLEAQHVHLESTNPETLRPLAEAGEPEKEQGNFAELQLA